MRKDDGEGTTYKGFDLRNMRMQKSTHHVFIGVANGELYSLFGVWESYSILMSEFKVGNIQV